MSRALQRHGATPWGALALLLSVSGWWLDPRMFFACWLAAWWFCLGVMLGTAVNERIHVLTGGRWGEVLAPANHLLRRRMPWLLLLFVPMLAGMRMLYPWAGDPSHLLASLDHPGFQHAWFAGPFVAVRFLAYALAWWWLARPAASRGTGRAALALLAYMLLTSLAAVDLLMSLVPGWTSSVFGWLTLTAQITAGAAAATGLAALLGNPSAGRPLPGQPPVWRDLGNLLLMYVLLQAYLQFMQFLIIWSENLPREISWYVPRLRTGWWMVGLSLVVLQCAVPTLALLWRNIKDRPRRLALVAVGMLLMQAVDSVWLVVPSVQAHGYAAWWMFPLITFGMVLLVFGHVGTNPHADIAGRGMLQFSREAGHG